MNYRIPIKGEEQLLKDNEGLVHYIVRSRFNSTNYEYEDLVQVGLIGLLKGIRTFKESESKFSTYVGVCIKNEILMLVKRKSPKSISLETEIRGYSNEVFTLNDVVADKDSEKFTEDLENKTLVENLLKTASDRDKLLIELVLDGKTQQEIGSILGVSQSIISRRIGCLSKYFKGEAFMKVIPLETKQQVVRLHKEGLSFAEITRKTGVSYPAIKRIIKDIENLSFLNSHRCVGMPNGYSVVLELDSLLLVLPNGISNRIEKCPWCQGGIK